MATGYDGIAAGALRRIGAPESGGL
jgi:hypothetical protein